jgi:hypothetical protein
MRDRLTALDGGKRHLRSGVWFQRRRLDMSPRETDRRLKLS